MQIRDEISSEEKHAALNLVLQSDTFARADQLKSFLRYVCELEIAGQASKITEYLIGVEALGRSQEFSPNDDTSVRNRAYALRHKLEKFYADERPSAEIRIEFLKGTYVPRFVAHRPAPEHPANNIDPVHLAAEPASSHPEITAGNGGEADMHRQFGTRFFRGRTLLVFAILGSLFAGALIGSLAMYLVDQRSSPASAGVLALDPVIREAWGPLLGKAANVLLCVATAAQLTVLPMDFKLEWNPPLPTFAAPAALYPWYLRYQSLPPGGKLFLGPNANSPHFGDVLGAMGVARVMTVAGVPFQFLPERLVPSATLNERNVVLFGVPHKSEAVRKLLRTGRFDFEYDPKLRDIFLSENKPGTPVGRRFLPSRDERADRVESFGLITVRPSPGVEGGHSRTVIFSGDPSAGAAAAADFFSSPSHMRALKQRFAKDGYTHFPAAYQVVVRCHIDSNLPTSVSYETHAILQ